MLLHERPATHAVLPRALARPRIRACASSRHSPLSYTSVNARGLPGSSTRRCPQTLTSTAYVSAARMRSRSRRGARRASASKREAVNVWQSLDPGDTVGAPNRNVARTGDIRDVLPISGAARRRVCSPVAAWDQGRRQKQRSPLPFHVKHVPRLTTPHVNVHPHHGGTSASHGTTYMRCRAPRSDSA